MLLFFLGCGKLDTWNPITELGTTLSTFFLDDAPVFSGSCDTSHKSVWGPHCIPGPQKWQHIELPDFLSFSSLMVTSPSGFASYFSRHCIRIMWSCVHATYTWKRETIHWKWSNGEMVHRIKYFLCKYKDQSTDSQNLQICQWGHDGPPVSLALHPNKDRRFL